MNVEIDNEQIEKLVNKAVNERVKTWFGENKYFIRDAVIDAVKTEVCVRVDESRVDIPKLATSLSTKELAEKITDNIGHNIASIFAERYDD